MLSFRTMNENVRLCLRKFVITIVCLCLLDFVIGGFSRFVFFQQRSGKFYRIHKAMTSANQRLLVFGSSHAASHYVPEILDKELRISSYNAGVLGQQILFHKTLESIILERVTPEAIILDVDPSTLYYAKEPYDRLAELKPFYFRHPEIVGPVLDYRSRLERLFLWSKLYQYNSTFVHVIRYAISPQPDWNGYRPAYGAMEPPTVEDEIAARGTYTVDRKLDPVMVDALERFAADAMRKDINIFYFISPGALPEELERNASFLKIRAIAAQSNIPFFNFRNHPEFVRNYSLFYDSGHLNDLGARRYSKLVADTIRDRLAARTFLNSPSESESSGSTKQVHSSAYWSLL
jgi:hypothetical protein